MLIDVPARFSRAPWLNAKMTPWPRASLAVHQTAVGGHPDTEKFNLVSDGLWAMPYSSSTVRGVSWDLHYAHLRCSRVGIWCSMTTQPVDSLAHVVRVVVGTFFTLGAAEHGEEREGNASTVWKPVTATIGRRRSCW